MRASLILVIIDAMLKNDAVIKKNADNGLREEFNIHASFPLKRILSANPFLRARASIFFQCF